MSIYALDPAPEFRELIQFALKFPNLTDTVVTIVLDWAKPESMLANLINWLTWLESHIQHSSHDHEQEWTSLKEKGIYLFYHLSVKLIFLS